MFFMVIVALVLLALVSGLAVAYADARWTLGIPSEAYPMFGMMGAMFGMLNALVFGAMLQLPVWFVAVAIILGPPLEVGGIALVVLGVMKLGQYVVRLGHQARENDADRGE
jgi:hypothetical protein